MTKSQAMGQSSVVSSFMGAGILGSSLVTMITTVAPPILLGIAVACGIAGGYFAYRQELKREC